jgi:hypothetical protein
MEYERTGPDGPDGPDTATVSGLRAELRLVEEEIDQARRTAAEFRSRIGGRAEGAVDAGDRSAAIAQAEEQEELLGILTTRREAIQTRIRALSAAG